MVRVQDVGLLCASDPAILDWAAKEDRILLTHDIETVTKYAYERIAENKHMAGVVEVQNSASTGRIIEDLLILLQCMTAEELAGQIIYLPL